MLFICSIFSSIVSLTLTFFLAGALLDWFSSFESHFLIALTSAGLGYACVKETFTITKRNIDTKSKLTCLLISTIAQTSLLFLLAFSLVCNMASWIFFMISINTVLNNSVLSLLISTAIFLVLIPTATSIPKQGRIKRIQKELARNARILQKPRKSQVIALAVIGIVSFLFGWVFNRSFTVEGCTRQTNGEVYVAYSLFDGNRAVVKPGTHDTNGNVVPEESSGFTNIYLSDGYMIQDGQLF